jgi:DNA-binding transcriptional LysR family regulator
MNFATFDLNLMRVLDALLHEGSTVRAGEKLHLSQSAVSGALSRLRHALDDDLFVRRGNRLVPTDYAAALALPLREELERLENLLSRPKRFDPARAQEVFRISGSDFFAEILMPALGERLRRLAPGIRVQLVDLVPYSYIDSIEQYRADLALIPQQEIPPWAECEPLFVSSFSVIARRGHPELEKAGLKPGDTVPMDLFCSLGHVVFSPEGRLQAMGDAALARVGRTRDVVMTLPVFSGVCRAVGGSDLVSLVPHQLGERLADELGLALYRPPMDVTPAQIVGVWHRRSTGNPAHAWMRALVFELLRPLDGA